MTLRSRTRHVRSLLPAIGLIFALAMASAPLMASADTDLPVGGTGVVAYANGDHVRIRTAPAPDADVAGSVPEGSAVAVIDGTLAADDGSLWYQVEADGIHGYMVADYLANSTGLLTTTTGEAVTIDAVNVRSGPSLADPILGTVSAGAWVSLTGENSDGWLSISYDGFSGYIYGAFLTQDGAGVVDRSPAAGETGSRYTLDAVNLRAGASQGEGVIAVVPAGTQVWLTGSTGGGFAEVESEFGNGWIATDYLGTEAPAVSAPAQASSLIIWPVSGGEWNFLQGYNGSSHYDAGLWQYGNSIDLVRADGRTGGQPIYSPVTGTVRWFDPATGGISIDMGNGYAFAMFHAYYDGGLKEGDAVAQGQYIGTIAPAGEGASGSTAHLHISVWATDDGGNWSRQSVPFTGALAISGNEYGNSGAGFEHTGTVVYP